MSDINNDKSNKLQQQSEALCYGIPAVEVPVFKSPSAILWFCPRVEVRRLEDPTIAVKTEWP